MQHENLGTGAKRLAMKAMGVCTHKCSQGSSAQWQEEYSFRSDAEENSCAQYSGAASKDQRGKLDQIHFLTTSQPPCVTDQSEFTLYKFSMP